MNSILIILLLLLMQLVNSSYSNFYDTSGLANRRCSICICLNIEHALMCNDIRIKIKLPITLPSSFTSLTLNNVTFVVPKLSQENFTTITHINHLKIIRSRITDIEPYTFSDLKQLKTLDLSFNKIKVISPYVFSGLNLEKLEIMSNVGIKIVETSFSNLKTGEINLRHNEIRQLNYSAFANTEVKKLFLYKNNIKYLDPKFKKLFEPKGHFIDLSDNPLDCSCRIKWIIPVLHRKISKNEIKAKSYTFRCKTPMKLDGKLMHKLDTKQLQCPPPKIKSIHVTFGIPTTQLTCTAVGDKDKAPGISWNYIVGNDVQESRRTPLRKSVTGTENLQTSFTINVTTPVDTTRAFTCTTWMENTNSEKIIVNIKAPKFPEFVKPTKRPKTNQNRDEKSKNTSLVITDGKQKDKDKYNKPPMPDYHYVFKKQFTILEMIGAVIGTFTATLFLLMLIAQCLRRRKKLKYQQHSPNTLSLYHPHSGGPQGVLVGHHHAPYSILPPSAVTNTTLLNTAHSNSSINLKQQPQPPYWTLGHDSNQTYAHPSSNPDYDTPRSLYEQNGVSSKPPSLCQSPPLNRMEFYDYKTHDRIFAS